MVLRDVPKGCLKQSLNQAEISLDSNKDLHNHEQTLNLYMCMPWELWRPEKPAGILMSKLIVFLDTFTA